MSGPVDVMSYQEGSRWQVTDIRELRPDKKGKMKPTKVGIRQTPHRQEPRLSSPEFAHVRNGECAAFPYHMIGKLRLRSCSPPRCPSFDVLTAAAPRRTSRQALYAAPQGRDRAPPFDDLPRAFPMLPVGQAGALPALGVLRRRSAAMQFIACGAASGAPHGRAPRMPP